MRQKRVNRRRKKAKGNNHVAGPAQRHALPWRIADRLQRDCTVVGGAPPACREGQLAEVCGLPRLAPAMLLSSLSTLRWSQHSRLPASAAAALACAWRGLAGSGSCCCGGGSDRPPPSNPPEHQHQHQHQHQHHQLQYAIAPRRGSSSPAGSLNRSLRAVPAAPAHTHNPVALEAQQAHKEPETPLVRHLKALIQVGKCHRRSGASCGAATAAPDPASRQRAAAATTWQVSAGMTSTCPVKSPT